MNSSDHTDLIDETVLKLFADLVKIKCDVSDKSRFTMGGKEKSKLNDVNMKVPESHKMIEVNSKVTFSKLPSCVIWQLLHYLNTDSIVSLAGVNTTLRQPFRNF